MSELTINGTVCTSPSGLLAQIQAAHIARRKRLGAVPELRQCIRQLNLLEAEIAGLQKAREAARAAVDAEREELLKVQRELVRWNRKNDYANHPIRLIAKITSDYYKISFADVISKRKTGPLILPRHVAMYLAKIKTDQSLPEIGRRLGGRDHTTILHGVRKIKNRLLIDPKLRDDVSVLLSRIAFVETQEQTNVDADTPVPAINK